MTKRIQRIKEYWQEPADGTKTSSGKVIYGKQKNFVLPLSLAEQLEKAAKKANVSQSRFVAEALTEKLNLSNE